MEKKQKTHKNSFRARQGDRISSQQEILQTLQEIKEEDMIIVVEGKNDKAALEHFNIKNIIVLNGKDIWNRCEEIATRIKQNNDKEEVVILTDFDAKGKELYGKISKNLTRLGIRINKEYREWFQKRTKLSHIEGLVKYVENRE
jgi:5S rRNA maturation endonuclease (ribonuclease M5)